MPAIDYFTEKGANTLAKRVREYWLKRGYLVETRVEQSAGNSWSHGAIFAVHSDLVAGKPTGPKVVGVAA